MNRSPVRIVAAIALAAYAWVIYELTLRPAMTESGPFGLAQRIASRLSGGELDWSQTEKLANVALFVPAGLLLAVVIGRFWISAALCVAASAAIELAQQRYLPSRVPSIADVEHNSIGGALGVLAGWPVGRWARRPAARPQPVPAAYAGYGA